MGDENYVLSCTTSCFLRDPHHICHTFPPFVYEGPAVAVLFHTHCSQFFKEQIKKNLNNLISLKFLSLPKINSHGISGFRHFKRKFDCFAFIFQIERRINDHLAYTFCIKCNFYIFCLIMDRFVLFQNVSFLMILIIHIIS